MKYKFLIPLILTSFTTITGQTFTKKDFSKTNWFTNNRDSMFLLESDTIHFIQRTNRGPSWDNYNFAEYEMKYLNHGDYINLKFLHKGKLEYTETYDNHINNYLQAIYTWEFDKKNTILKIFRDNNIFMKLKPVKKEIIDVESKYANDKRNLKTLKITLIKQ